MLSIGALIIANTFTPAIAKTVWGGLILYKVVKGVKKWHGRGKK